MSFKIERDRQTERQRVKRPGKSMDEYGWCLRLAALFSFSVSYLCVYVSQFFLRSAIETHTQGRNIERESDREKRRKRKKTTAETYFIYQQHLVRHYI